MGPAGEGLLLSHCNFSARHLLLLIKIQVQMETVPWKRKPELAVQVTKSVKRCKSCDL